MNLPESAVRTLIQDAVTTIKWMQEYHHEQLEDCDSPGTIESLEHQIEIGDEGIKALLSALALMDVAPAATAPTESRLGGEVCGTGSCGHVSNIHSGGKGLCCSASCGCMTFTPTGNFR